MTTRPKFLVYFESRTKMDYMKAKRDPVNTELIETIQKEYEALPNTQFKKKQKIESTLKLENDVSYQTLKAAIEASKIQKDALFQQVIANRKETQHLIEQVKAVREIDLTLEKTLNEIMKKFETKQEKRLEFLDV